MREVYLKNYRCFGEEQVARLAPLTLLVGENSSGKTSFLAIIQALMHLSSPHIVTRPGQSVFNTPPFDLGSFDEIAYQGARQDRKVKTFRAGFVSSVRTSMLPGLEHETFRYDFRFAKNKVGPTLVGMRLTLKDNWLEITSDLNQSPVLNIGSHRGSWEWKSAETALSPRISLERNQWYSTIVPILELFADPQKGYFFLGEFVPLNGSADPRTEDNMTFFSLVQCFKDKSLESPIVFASSPVRSRPVRTYNPLPFDRDPEGRYAPMYLALLSSTDRNGWKNLKDRLELFGVQAGLFDELSVRHLGKKNADPFQVYLKGKMNGHWRNLVDVGYGVSQVLPLLIDTHLGESTDASMHLIQQPEVHLHASAQAALGSFFCQIADRNNQLIVETQSDQILNRVRMDVRDRVSHLRPEDVSILYFERGEDRAKIHSLRIDKEGNILGAPNGYRRFFRVELKRSFGL